MEGIRKDFCSAVDDDDDDDDDMDDDDIKWYAIVLIFTS